MMSGIKSKNTKPEKLIRSAMHARGYRYVLHDKRFPGKPDLVFPKYRAVIFVNGCFWHGHECHLFKWPSSNAAFWQNKISRNIAVDQSNLERIRASGWRTAVIRECALKGKARLPLETVARTLERWLHSGEDELFIQGQN